MLNFSHKLLLFLSITIVWFRAGLGLQSVKVTWLAGLTVLFICYVISKLRKLKAKESPSPVFIIGILLAIFFTSSRNTIFNEINHQTLKTAGIGKYFASESDLSKSIMLSREIKKILPFIHDAPNRAITIFLDFNNRYTDNFGSVDPAGKLLKKIIDIIDRKPSPYLPTNPLVNYDTWINFFFFISQLAIGFLAYYFIKKKHLIRRFVIYIAASAVILAIVGIVQKLNYEPADNLKEIFGIWDTPEPRYFYASFTYKNHWSAYAILMLSCLIALCVRKISKYHFLRHIHRSTLLYLLGMLILIISIPHSGSRSGVLILLSLFTVLALIISKRKVLHFKTKHFAFGLLFLCLSSFGGFLLNKDTTQEMLSNSISQIQNEKTPLRILLWKDLIHQISKKTFWGYGYDSYGTINPLFQSKVVRDERAIGLANAHTPYIPLLGYGHSDILEWVTEFGWVGIVLLLLPAILLICRNLSFSRSIFAQIISIGGLCFLLYCCFDFPTRSPACLISFSLLLGLSTRYTNLSLNKNFH